MAEYVGVVLTPHQFRHLAAERFLAAYPGHYEALRQLLGHKSVTTTIRSYCRNEDKAAAVCFDALITGRRTTLRGDAPAQEPGLAQRRQRRGRH
jgi:integrase